MELVPADFYKSMTTYGVAGRGEPKQSGGRRVPETDGC
jgi:hypothetical protein